MANGVDRADSEPIGARRGQGTQAQGFLNQFSGEGQLLAVDPHSGAPRHREHDKVLSRVRLVRMGLNPLPVVSLGSKIRCEGLVLGRGLGFWRGGRAPDFSRNGGCLGGEPFAVFPRCGLFRALLIVLFQTQGAAGLQQGRTQPLMQGGRRVKAHEARIQSFFGGFLGAEFEQEVIVRYDVLSAGFGMAGQDTVGRMNVCDPFRRPVVARAVGLLDCFLPSMGKERKHCHGVP